MIARTWFERVACMCMSMAFFPLSSHDIPSYFSNSTTLALAVDVDVNDDDLL